MDRRIKVECGECGNTRCFIKLCNPEYVSFLNEKKNQVVLGKGQFVFREGSPVFGIYFIQQGKVKVVISNFDDKEQTVRLAGDGHILGHRGYGDETYPIGAITLDDTRICFLDNDILYDAFKVNFDFLYSIMMFYSKELRKSEMRTKYFAQMTVEEKVTFALIYIIDAFGFKNEGETLNVVLSRKEIADIAGTNADQVSRTIASLKKQGHISTQGNRIVVENYESMKNIITHHINDAF